MRYDNSGKDRGSGLIVLVIVTAFLLAVGLLLLYVTGAGPQVAGNLRLQEQAFNAAEAGFDNAWSALEGYFIAAGWENFDGHYVTLPAGIDLPADDNYFRKKTDQDILTMLDPGGDGTADDPNVIFYKIPYVLNPSGGLDTRYAYTAFLIDDEGGLGTPDAYDTLLICIGTVQVQGRIIASSRLEIVLTTQLPGGP